MELLSLFPGGRTYVETRRLPPGRKNEGPHDGPLHLDSWVEAAGLDTKL